MLLAVPPIIVPRMTAQDPVNIPDRRPQVSRNTPTNGSAETPPMVYIPWIKEALAPTKPEPKVSRNCSMGSRAPIREPSNPELVSGENFSSTINVFFSYHLRLSKGMPQSKINIAFSSEHSRGSEGSSAWRCPEPVSPEQSQP